MGAPINRAGAVIVAAGAFLNGVIHVGLCATGGRADGGTAVGGADGVRPGVDVR